MGEIKVGAKSAMLSGISPRLAARETTVLKSRSAFLIQSATSPSISPAARSGSGIKDLAALIRGIRDSTDEVLRGLKTLRRHNEHVDSKMAI